MDRGCCWPWAPKFLAKLSRFHKVSARPSFMSTYSLLEWFRPLARRAQKIRAAAAATDCVAWLLAGGLSTFPRTASAKESMAHGTPWARLLAM
eukprot:1220871-Amphidinium_carterae.1